MLIHIHVLLKHTTHLMEETIKPGARNSEWEIKPKPIKQKTNKPQVKQSN